MAIKSDKAHLEDKRERLRGGKKPAAPVSTPKPSVSSTGPKSKTGKGKSDDSKQQDLGGGSAGPGDGGAAA